jgi:rhamnose transport system substrate-binding protein
MAIQRMRLAAMVASAGIVLAACSSAATPAPATPAPATAAPATAAPATPAPATPAPATPAPSVAASAAAAGPNVVFIPKQVNNPYFDAAALGGKKAAAELGGQFTQVGPQNAVAAEQVPFIQDATTKGYSAIAISADGADEVAPALQAAMAAGIKVVGYDSSPAKGAYNVFVNQVDFSGVGVNLADWACQLAPNCTGEIAILSASATATNQNAWIDLMKKTLTEPKYKGLKLVDVVYGNDDPQVSTTQAQALLQKYPNLKVIVAPTTVGILAAAQVVKQAGKSATTKVTGLGFPNDMRAFVKDGTSPVFGLWSVPDLGYITYYIADMLVKGTITGAPGETFTVPNMNGGQPYTIGPDSVVIMGPAFQFDASNIDQFNF